MSDYFLGLISGTSADGIDAALVQFEPFKMRAARTFAFPEAWRALTLSLGAGQASVDLDQLGQLDVALGHAFAEAALELIASSGVAASEVVAIGSHGQTVRHRPHLPYPFTLQIGCPHVIAERTGVRVVADFRRRDLAAGGQGAPLVPAFHAAFFGNGTRRVVLNLGGIANVTLLPEHAQQAVRGFDTGPANGLLDAYSEQSFGVSCDHGGARAASGKVLPEVLESMLRDAYFAQSGPKSTGREYFGNAWLRQHVPEHSAPEDVLSTLCELTARSVSDAICRFLPAEVLVCGGGVHNQHLLGRLAFHLNPIPVRSTAHYGLDPDFVEAAAFAWLAQQMLKSQPGSLAAVTGAQGPRVLGSITAPN